MGDISTEDKRDVLDVDVLAAPDASEPEPQEPPVYVSTLPEPRKRVDPPIPYGLTLVLLLLFLLFVMFMAHQIRNNETLGAKQARIEQEASMLSELASQGQSVADENLPEPIVGHQPLPASYVGVWEAITFIDQNGTYDLAEMGFYATAELSPDAYITISGNLFSSKFIDRLIAYDDAYGIFGSGAAQGQMSAFLPVATVHISNENLIVFYEGNYRREEDNYFIVFIKVSDVAEDPVFEEQPDKNEALYPPDHVAA